MKEFNPATVRPTPQPRSKRIRLLCVEDEDLNWEMAERRLRTTYEIDRACNSAEALEKLSQVNYDAILMDIQLKESTLDGIELTRLLKRSMPPLRDAPPSAPPRRTPPIIFVTAYSESITKGEVGRFGGDDLITKPVDFVKLSLAIARLVAQRIGGA